VDGTSVVGYHEQKETWKMMGGFPMCSPTFMQGPKSRDVMPVHDLVTPLRQPSNEWMATTAEAIANAI
jgi:hypothetical protein